MWDPVTECGVLDNFDVQLSGDSPLGPVAGTRMYTEPGDLMVSELLGCKEFCKWRSKRVYLDRIEPFVWILAEMCLGDGGLELSLRLADGLNATDGYKAPMLNLPKQ